MYKIVSLKSENVKKLKAITITPDGNVITLTGENGAGKSSVLDSIAMALGGEKLVPDQPIRKGQKSAEVTVDLGELVVTRRFTAAGSEVIVKNANGVKQEGPQGILNRLVGKLAFDPLEFAGMEPKKQLDTLRAMVGLDFTALDAKRKDNYDRRTLVNRDADTARTKLAATTFDQTAPADEVSAVELSDELTRINAHNQANAQRRLGLQTMQSTRTTAEEKTRQLGVKLKEAQKAYEDAIAAEEQLISDINEAKEAVEKLQDKDAAAVRTQIATADEINRKVRANASHNELKLELVKHENASGKLTQMIEAIDADKEAQLAAAKFPLKELSFNETGIVFNGTPFSQASDAEKLRTSVAIGMAMNPKLRVMFVRNGSLLDANGLKIIAELAEAQDFQIWVEDARSTDPAAITIADGEVQE